MANEEGWSNVLEDQLAEILETSDQSYIGACVADVCVNNKMLTDLLRASLFATIKDGMRLALSRPICKHCRDSKWCDKKLGIMTLEGCLCMPLGLGSLILLSCLKGYPACSGYEY